MAEQQTRMLPLLSQRDKRPPRGPWAPGTYTNICHICEQHFVGDKRAGLCAPCAYGQNSHLFLAKEVMAFLDSMQVFDGEVRCNASLDEIRTLYDRAKEVWSGRHNDKSEEKTVCPKKRK